MPLPKIISTGTVIIDADGQVRIEGFEYEDAGRRDEAQLSMAWAVEKLGAALLEDMTADEPILSSID